MRTDRRIAAERQPRRPSLAQVETHAAEAAALLKALANEQRLQVLCVLLDGPHSVGEINSRVTLSQSALSQHLAVLRDAQVVTTRRQSQTIFYELAPGPANRVMEALYAAYCAPRGAGRRAAGNRQPRENGQCS